MKRWAKKTPPGYILAHPDYNICSNSTNLLAMADDTILNQNSKQWLVKERSWCVNRYFEVRSYVKIQEFLHVFKTDKAPDKKRIEDWMNKF